MATATLQEPQAAAPAPPTTLRAGDVVRAMLRAKADADAGKPEGHQALLEGAQVLQAAMYAGGSKPTDIARRAGASEALRAFDYDNWERSPERRSREARARERIADMQQRMQLGEYEGVDVMLKTSADELQQLQENDATFRRMAGESLLRQKGTLASTVVTERDKAAPGSYFVRPELDAWEVNLDDPSWRHNAAILNEPLSDFEGRRGVQTELGFVQIPELDQLAKDSIKESILGANPWSPHALSVFRESLGFMRAAGDKLHDWVVDDDSKFEGRTRNVSSADPGVVLPFLPNLSGLSDSVANEDQAVALSLERMRDPAWSRAVADEVRAVAPGARPSLLDTAIGAAGFAADFAAVTAGFGGLAKAGGAVALARAPISVKAAAEVAKNFARVSEAGRAGQVLPIGLTGTGEMVAYENLKAVVTGENLAEATKRGVLFGAGASAASVVARPMVSAAAAVWSRLGLPGAPALEAAAQVRRVGGVPPELFWQRLVNRQSQRGTIDELVHGTLRDARWAQAALRWADSYAIGAQMGAWDAARMDLGDEQWDALPLPQKVVEAAKRVGSDAAVGTGLGFAAVGMLQTGLSRTRLAPQYARMQAEEKAAVDAMTGHLKDRLTSPQMDLADWAEAVTTFEAYLKAHPEAFHVEQLPKAPPPGGPGYERTAAANDPMQEARFVENNRLRERYMAGRPRDFDPRGRPLTARAIRFFEKHPVERRGTARLAEISDRFHAVVPEARMTPDGPTYAWNKDLTGNPDFYALRNGPYAVRRMTMIPEIGPITRPGERPETASLSEAQGWAIVHADTAKTDAFGTRIAGTKVYADRADAMAVALAIAIRNGFAPRYATRRGQNLPGEEPPPPPAGLPLEGGPGPKGPPGPVAPLAPGELRQGAPSSTGQQQLTTEPGTGARGAVATPGPQRREMGDTGAKLPSGQRYWWTALSPEEAQRTLDAHHTDPEHLGKSPHEVVQAEFAKRGRAETIEEARAHELQNEPPAPAGEPGAVPRLIEEDVKGRAPLPEPPQVMGAAEAAGLAREVVIQREEIGVDPLRFQFKAVDNSKAGVKEEDLGGDFNPRFLGSILVWQDKAGKYWVADGHHRMERARRAGFPVMKAEVLREADGITAEMARADAALRNMANGKGTPLDGAKVMRDLGWTVAKLKSLGVNVSSGFGRDMAGLSKLADSVFSMVVNGDIPMNYGGIIGRELEGQEGKQLEAVRTVKRVSNADEAAIAVRNIKHAVEVTLKTEDMFGGQTETRSLASERAKIEVEINRRLATEKATFNQLVKRANTVQKVKGNVVDVAATKAEAQTVASVVDELAKRATLKGPVSDVLNEAAARLAKGDRQEVVVDDAIQRLSEVDWTGTNKPRPVEVQRGAQPQEGVQPAKSAPAVAPAAVPPPKAGEPSESPVYQAARRTWHDRAMEHRKAADAHAGEAFNILSTGGAFDPNTTEGMGEFSRQLDALVRNQGDARVILERMKQSGRFADTQAALTAFKAAQKSARAVRTSLQKAAWATAEGDQGMRRVLHAYQRSLQEHADLGKITPEVRKLLIDAGLMNASGEVNHEATRLLGEYVDLRIGEAEEMLARRAAHGESLTGEVLQVGLERSGLAEKRAPTAEEQRLEAEAKAYNDRVMMEERAARAQKPAVAEMPKGAQIGTDLLGNPIFAKEERGDIGRPGEGVKGPEATQIDLFGEQGGMFEGQAEARDKGLGSKPGGGSEAGFIVNPVLGFTALVKGLWRTFSESDTPSSDYAAVKALRLRGLLDRLLPTQRARMNAQVNKNQRFLPESLMGLARAYNAVGGMWSNTILPSRVLALQKGAVTKVLRPNQAAAGDLLFQLEGLFARHLTWDGQRVGSDDLKALYHAVDSGTFRTLRDENHFAKLYGEKRRYLWPALIEITELANAVLDEGVRLGRFDPRQADKMRSRWIPHEYVRASRDQVYQQATSGLISPIVDRHSLSRSASAEDQAKLLHGDPYYLWQSALRREARTNSFLQMLHDLRERGYAIPHEKVNPAVPEPEPTAFARGGPAGLMPVFERPAPKAPTWHQYQRDVFETAAIGDRHVGQTKSNLDPMNGRQVVGRQVRFAQLLRRTLDGMQSKDSYERGEMAPPDKAPFTPELYELVRFYLGPKLGEPDVNGKVEPGAFIPEQLARELDWLVDGELQPNAPWDGGAVGRWMSQKMGVAVYPMAVFGAALRAWRQNVTVMSYAHWTGNQLSSVATNWGSGRVPISDYVTSILYGRGFFAESMRDGMAYQDYLDAGMPEVRPADMPLDTYNRARRFRKTADALSGGLFVNTVVKRGGIRALIANGLEPDAITAQLALDLSKAKGLSGHQRAELEFAIADLGRRMSTGQGGYERTAFELLGSRDPAAKVAATQALHGHYGIWELIHKHAGSLAFMDKFPGASPERAATWGAVGTVDYGDTSPMIRSSYNDPMQRRSQAYYQTEAHGKLKQLGRVAIANPFALYMAGGIPRWTRDFAAHPLRSAAVMGFASGITASMWAAYVYLKQNGDERAQDMLQAMARSRGFEGLPTYRPHEAQAVADGIGYQAVGSEDDIPQGSLREMLAFVLANANGTAPAPNSMVTDVGRLVPQADMVFGTAEAVRNAASRSFGDNVEATTDAILGLNAELARGMMSGAFKSLATDQATSGQARKMFALDVLRRTMPQTGDFWWASRGGQDAIGSMMGQSFGDMIRGMPMPNQEAESQVAQAAWRWMWNARAIRPYSGWKDDRDLGQAIASATGVRQSDPLGQPRQDYLTAARALAQWAPRAVSTTYENFRFGRFSEPATLDSMMAWQFGIAHDLKPNARDLELVDNPETPIGKWIKGQMLADPIAGEQLLQIAFKYVHSPEFVRGVAPVLEISRSRHFPAQMIEEAFRSSARDPSGSGLLKMSLAHAKSHPEDLDKVWAIYRNLPYPDRGSVAESAYLELKEMFRERDRGILSLPPAPNLMDLFGSQAVQAGLPAVQTVIRQEQQQ